MREIKFRAWDKKEKKWLFGYEYPNLGGFNLIGEITLMGELSSIPLLDWEHIEIMQYTGLKDKNGKEIYQGDILQAPNPLNFKNPFIIEIKWRNEHTSFNVPNSSLDCEYREVIGNIYQNPELLEK